tara:strand:+ start:1096 stop:1710 length:615 start_codon:yes stop_codon:yes gene_type:complete
MSEEESDQLTLDLEEQVEKLTFKEPKKRQLSESALAKLALARKRALEVRKANYEKKLKAKEDLKEAQIRKKVAAEDSKAKKKDELNELVDTAEKELIESKKKNAIEPDSEEEASVIKKAKSKKPKSKKTKIVIANDSDSSSDDDTPQIYIRTKKKKKPKPAAVTHDQVVQDYMPTVPIQEVQDQHHIEQPPPIARQQPYWMSFQ